MSQCFVDDRLWHIAKSPDLLWSGLRDGPVMTMLTSKVARCRIDTEVFMTRYHVIHRFQFDGIDLKAAWSSVNQASKYPRPIFPITTEASPSFRYKTSTKAELTMNSIIFTPFVKHGLPIEAFLRRRLNFFRLGEGREEVGTHASKEPTEE